MEQTIKKLDNGSYEVETTQKQIIDKRVLEEELKKLEIKKQEIEKKIEEFKSLIA